MQTSSQLKNAIHIVTNVKNLWKILAMWLRFSTQHGGSYSSFLMLKVRLSFIGHPDQPLPNVHSLEVKDL